MLIAGKKRDICKLCQRIRVCNRNTKVFWLNLQANYEVELLEANELQTITEEERIVREDLKEIVKYFRERGMMPSRENKDEFDTSLR